MKDFDFAQSAIIPFTYSICILLKKMWSNYMFINKYLLKKILSLLFVCVSP